MQRSLSMSVKYSMTTFVRGRRVTLISKGDARRQRLYRRIATGLKSLEIALSKTLMA